MDGAVDDELDGDPVAGEGGAVGVPVPDDVPEVGAGVGVPSAHGCRSTRIPVARTLRSS